MGFSGNQRGDKISCDNACGLLYLLQGQETPPERGFMTV